MMLLSPPHLYLGISNSPKSASHISIFPSLSTKISLCFFTVIRAVLCFSEISCNSSTTQKILRLLNSEQRTPPCSQSIEQLVGLTHHFLCLNNLRPLRVSPKNVLTNCTHVTRILLNHNCMQQSWNLTWILQAPGWETPKDTKEIMKVLFARLRNHWQHGY